MESKEEVFLPLKEGKNNSDIEIKVRKIEVFKTISPEYKKLLIKFCSNKELTELIKECILDLEKAKELHYNRNNKYPEERNPLMKLLFDLEQVRLTMEEVKNNEKQIETS